MVLGFLVVFGFRGLGLGVEGFRVPDRLQGARTRAQCTSGLLSGLTVFLLFLALL